MISSYGVRAIEYYETRKEGTLDENLSLGRRAFARRLSHVYSLTPALQLGVKHSWANFPV